MNTSISNQEITIVPMKYQHLEAAHALNIHLGYVISLEGFQKNFERLNKSSDDVLFVAISKSHVIGWMHLKVQNRLQDHPALEIVALVIDEHCRGKGVGRLLIAQAEFVAQEIGLHHIILFSNSNFIEAHTFYEKLGFTNKKTSKWFIKNVE